MGAVVIVAVAVVVVVVVLVIVLLLVLVSGGSGSAGGRPVAGVLSGAGFALFASLSVANCCATTWTTRASAKLTSTCRSLPLHIDV